METKQETKQETKETVKDAVGAGTLASDDIVVSVLDVDENGATIKLWPDAAAVRDKLNALAQTLYGDDYNLRRYLCGKALYCAIAIGDTTRDAPCPAGYQVNADANLNEADGSLVAAAAEWGLGFGVFNLPPRRIGKEWLQINPVAGRDGKTIHHYVLGEKLTVAGIRYEQGGRVAEVHLRRSSDGSVIRWPVN